MTENRPFTAGFNIINLAPHNLSFSRVLDRWVLKHALPLGTQSQNWALVQPVVAKKCVLVRFVDNPSNLARRRPRNRLLQAPCRECSCPSLLSYDNLGCFVLGPGLLSERHCVMPGPTSADVNTCIRCPKASPTRTCSRIGGFGPNSHVLKQSTVLHWALVQPVVRGKMRACVLCREVVTRLQLS